MLTDVQAVVFDLDGTLLDRRRSFELFVRDQWQRFPAVTQAVDEDEYVSILVELDGDGDRPRSELFSRVVARFALPHSLAGTLLSDYRSGFPNACRLFPDARRVLSRLRSSGLKLGLITNGSVRMQNGKVQSLGLASTFDSILISDAEGLSKPNPEIFQLALARLDVSAAGAVYVGDRPEVDIAGARAAKIRAVWRRDPLVSRKVDADATIEELADLLPLLGLPAGRTPES